MDKALPLTLEDGELFGQGEGMWEFACWKKKVATEGNRP
jgi:hypothetical protein